MWVCERDRQRDRQRQRERHTHRERERERERERLRYPVGTLNFTGTVLNFTVHRKTQISPKPLSTKTKTIILSFLIWKVKPKLQTYDEVMLMSSDVS